MIGKLPAVRTHCVTVIRNSERDGLPTARRRELRIVSPEFRWHRFVRRTDVKSYYDQIDHERLLNQLEQTIPKRDVRRLLVQIVKRFVEYGGLYRDVPRGIGRGSPLSPLFGALYLKPLDDALDQGLDKHPDKTWIGKIDRGFDILGYQHTLAGCRPAQDTRRRFLRRLTRPYEQDADNQRIGAYQERWWRWVCGGCLETSCLSNSRAQGWGHCKLVITWALIRKTAREG